MYYVFKENKLILVSSTQVSADLIESVEYDFTEEEIKKLESGCLYIDGNIIETEEYINSCIEDEIKFKMNRLYDIDTELKKLNAPGITITKESIIALNDAKIAELNIEADEIQTYISANYESSLVDDIYTSLFL